MPRRILVKRADGSIPILTETIADNEAQLQDLMKENIDLLPVDDLGVTGPIMVVGRETTLPSGAVDIVGLTRGGEILIIEFKTGPENQDFRRALAQLLDYGSDIWGMTYEEFERTIATRYFASSHCRDERVQGKSSLDEAVRAVWPDLSPEESDTLNSTLIKQLATGAFAYVLVAQRFTETTKRTIDYLNTISQSARFRAVEIVRFEGDGLSAFESRAITSVVRPSSERQVLSETQFLDQVDDQDYRASLREFFELCHGLSLALAWGSVGVSVRLDSVDTQKPFSVAWLFPPNRVGWMGLTDLSLGYDILAVALSPQVQAVLDWYLDAVSALPSAEVVRRKSVKASKFSPQAFKTIQQPLAEILAELVRRVREQA